VGQPKALNHVAGIFHADVGRLVDAWVAGFHGRLLGASALEASVTTSCGNENRQTCSNLAS